ncbi:MAG TPA: monovalent cation/H(+) antiporter subunit G, partial [Acetobacteraceae bacterium]|nr:monovalent cation/H(+) antiporter subunit G [Acetobacteraceae bacterium]
MIAVSLLLAVLVLLLWLAAWGFARLRTPYDRIHCTSFATLAAAVPLVLVAFVSDGASDRACKILLLAALMLVSGATLAHATGRAI